MDERAESIAEPTCLDVAAPPGCSSRAGWLVLLAAIAIVAGSWYLRLGKVLSLTFLLVLAVVGAERAFWRHGQRRRVLEDARAHADEREWVRAVLALYDLGRRGEAARALARQLAASGRHGTTIRIAPDDRPVRLAVQEHVFEPVPLVGCSAVIGTQPRSTSAAQLAGRWPWILWSLVTLVVAAVCVRIGGWRGVVWAAPLVLPAVWHLARSFWSGEWGWGWYLAPGRILRPYALNVSPHVEFEEFVRGTSVLVAARTGWGYWVVVVDNGRQRQFRLGDEAVAGLLAGWLCPAPAPPPAHLRSWFGQA